MINTQKSTLVINDYLSSRKTLSMYQVVIFGRSAFSDKNKYQFKVYLE